MKPWSLNASGFRIDSSPLKRKLQLVRDHLRVDIFKPVLLEYVRKTLNECIKLTPARDYQVIQRAQNNQYNNRINYIPTVHDPDADPRLVVNGSEHWLFRNGKWWKANEWKLPSNIWAAYQTLLDERNRRMETSRSEFVKGRAQARNLYKKSWVQVGESIGLDIRASGTIRDSQSRRKPPKLPPAGYAQIRGGKTTINVVISNPFLTEQTAYWHDDAREIMAEAIPIHRNAFNDKVQRILKRAIYAIFKQHGGG